jgi:hypothetical protein
MKGIMYETIKIGLFNFLIINIFNIYDIFNRPRY